LALAQINPTVGDLAGNWRKIVEYIENARQLGADLVAFPELVLSGYPPEDLLLKQSFVADCGEWLDRVRAAASGIAAIIGFPQGRVGQVSNAAAVINDGCLAGVYRKALLPNYGVFDEMRYFQPGDGRQVFEIGGITTGISICEDIWHHDGPPRLQAHAGGARLLLNISASPYHAGKGGERAEMLASRARDYGAVVAYVNLVGAQDELVFDGQSLVFDSQGRLIARAPQFEEQLLVVDLEISGLPGIAPHNVAQPPSAVEGRDESRPSRGGASSPPGTPRSTAAPGPPIERTVVPLAARFGKRPAVETLNAEPLDRLAEIYRALVVGTRDYVRKNGFARVVIGLSGGVDSSLTAAVAADALGASNVVGAAMPSPYSSAQSLADAQELARNLGIELRVLSIGDIFRSYLETLRQPFAGRPPDVAEENLQARIRGNLLMALSNKFGWLVLTTGNKSEIAVGYATLYGDMAGGFAVIKDIPKTLVYELARWRNAQQQSQIIPARVMTKEPSAELRPNQRDTDSLPPYSVLDPILKAYVEQDRSLEQIIAMGFDRDTVRYVTRLVDRNEYKRRQAAPGVKITHKAFGRDRRLPITNRYAETP
jgi:NAD+ synthase (glutamine-hydrolysing)